MQGKAASFNATYRLEDAGLVLEATHRMEKRVYDAQDWPDFRTALKERLRLMETPVIIAR